MPYYSPYDFMDFMRFLKEPVNFRDFVIGTTKHRKKKPSWNYAKKKKKRK